MAISYPKVAEDYYRDKLASLLIEAETEQSTVHGVIDVLTPFEIIEVKKLHKWKEALGQVLAYGHDPEYSSLIKRVHLIVPFQQ